MELNQKSETTRFNHKQLYLARKSRGLPQAWLAKQIGIPQAKFSLIESGDAEPNSEIIVKIAQELRYPAKFFSESTELYHPISFPRQKRSTGVKYSEMVISKLNILRCAISRLTSIVDIPEFTIPSFYGVPDVTPELAAQRVKFFWKLPVGPLRNLADIIEESGVLIVRLDFGTPEIDAVTITARNHTPVIFIRANLPPDRFRFTLAHEIGHIVLHRDIPTDETEKEAHRFAAELLMPRRDILPDLRRLSIDKLAQLKLKWEVSMAALIKRAKDTECISNEYSRKLMMQMSMRGYRLVEPVSIPMENPQLLSDILRVLTDDYKRSTEYICDLMSLVKDDLLELAYIPENGAPTLRLLEK
jgi:Zn-dependent peptidase ImmA (M78 family)/DNA-binding XRE family transcriptional regulator